MIGARGRRTLRFLILTGLCLLLLVVESVAEGLGTSEMAFAPMFMAFAARELEPRVGLSVALAGGLSADALSGEPSGIVFGSLLYGYLILRSTPGRRTQASPASVVLLSGWSTILVSVVRNLMAALAGAEIPESAAVFSATILAMATAWPVFAAFSYLDRRFRPRDELRALA
ncbi:MAG: rod shape-determining protein MreD [Myxococcota bacterium]